MESEIAFEGIAPAADVEITLSGVATPDEFRRFSETLAGDPHYRAGLLMLVDVSALDTSELSVEALQELTVPILERDWYHPPAAVAIIAAGSSHADALRYRAFLGGSRSNREVFEARDDAVAWLAAKRLNEDGAAPESN